MYNSNKKSITYFILTILFSIVFVGTSGCSDDKPKDEIPEYITDEFREDFPEKFKSLPNEKLNFPPEAPLDDEEFWSEPRVQFVWRKQLAKPTDEDLSHYVFSMKLDGSDIRIVAGPEILFPEGSGTIGFSSIGRSRNNRYLAYYDGFYYLLDLQTKERTRMTNKRSNGYPILWAGDNNTVYFQGKRGMKQYNVPAKTLKPLLKHGKEEFFPWPRFILDNGTALAYVYKGLHKLDTNGNLIETIQAPICDKKNAKGGYWLVNDWMQLYSSCGKRFIYSINDKRTISLGKDIDNFYNDENNTAFSPYDLDAYHITRNDSKLAKTNVVTKKPKIIIDRTVYASSFSIINYPPTRFQN